MDEGTGFLGLNKVINALAASREETPVGGGGEER